MQVHLGGKLSVEQKANRDDSKSLAMSVGISERMHNMFKSLITFLLKSSS